MKLGTLGPYRFLIFLHCANSSTLDSFAKTLLTPSRCAWWNTVRSSTFILCTSLSHQIHYGSNSRLLLFRPFAIKSGLPPCRRNSDSKSAIVPYKPSEGLYATFQFFYRSRGTCIRTDFYSVGPFTANLPDPLSDQLQQFHFPGFPPLLKTPGPRSTRLLNARMADLTPLSISLPLDQKKKKIQLDQDSYEAKVKTKGFRPDDGQKLDFGSEYRDIRAMSPSAVNEACEKKKSLKYPAAPLPFLANKPFESTKLDPLSLKISPTTVAAPFLVGKPVATDLKHKTKTQEKARRSFNSDTRTSITAEPSSSLPSSTDFIKEQMGTITGRDDYRPTAGDPYPSDQEEDAADEHATESDLETHVDDDDFKYAVDHEVDDEGYDSLQSQFKNVRIHKRRRDDVEDVGGDNETWHGDDAAHLDGHGKQSTLKLPSTEGRRAYRGKKSRTTKPISSADGGPNAHGAEKTQAA